MPNAEFVMDCVQQIDLASRNVHTTRNIIPYDYLIVALGSTTDYFGVPGAAEHALPLKTVEDGVAIRNRLLSSYERAAHEADKSRRKGLLTFVVIGGGPTGIEYAGALAELVYGPMIKDYPGIDREEVSIVLIEMVDRLLGAFPARIGSYAQKRLEGMGIQVCLNSAVSSIEKGSVLLKDGKNILSETVVWTAGIRGVPEAASPGLPLVRGGRVGVLPTLQASGHDEVYVTGDLAFLQADGQPLPVVAPVAVQQGRAAARNILLHIKGKPVQPFAYKDRGAMVTIGRNAAAAYMGDMVFTGFIAWLLWLGVHIFNLIGIPNRLFVLLDWALDYFFMERTVRLILPGEDNCEKPKQPIRSR
jgi:NADH dehydrogenase